MTKTLFAWNGYAELPRSNHTIVRDTFAGQHADAVADLHLLCGNDLFLAVAQDSCGLRRQMYRFFNPGTVKRNSVRR